MAEAHHGKQIFGQVIDGDCSTWIIEEIGKWTIDAYAEKIVAKAHHEARCCQKMRCLMLYMDVSGYKVRRGWVSSRNQLRGRETVSSAYLKRLPWAFDGFTSTQASVDSLGKIGRSAVFILRSWSERSCAADSGCQKRGIE